MDNRNRKEDNKVEIQVIEERELLDKQLRIYGDFDNPLFLATDVAEWLDYAKTGQGYYDISKMLANVDENEKLLRKIFVAGQLREKWFLTEDGLYETFMLSKKPKAKELKKKVKEILKSIRRNGMYATNELLDNPELAIQVFTKLKEEREKNRLLENKIEQDKPKTEYYDKVLNTSNEMTTTVIAKSLGISAQALNKFLHNEGIIYKQSDSWFFYTRYQDKGYGTIATVTYTNKEGIECTKHYLKWTEKGREFIVNLWNNKE